VHGLGPLCSCCGVLRTAAQRARCPSGAPTIRPPARHIKYSVVTEHSLPTALRLPCLPTAAARRCPGCCHPTPPHPFLPRSKSSSSRSSSHGSSRSSSHGCSSRCRLSPWTPCCQPTCGACSWEACSWMVPVACSWEEAPSTWAVAASSWAVAPAAAAARCPHPAQQLPCSPQVRCEPSQRGPRVHEAPSAWQAQRLLLSLHPL